MDYENYGQHYDKTLNNLCPLCGGLTGQEALSKYTIAILRHRIYNAFPVDVGRNTQNQNK